MTNIQCHWNIKLPLKPQKKTITAQKMGKRNEQAKKEKKNACDQQAAFKG